MVFDDESRHIRARALFFEYNLLNNEKDGVSNNKTNIIVKFSGHCLCTNRTEVSAKMKQCV